MSDISNKLDQITNAFDAMEAQDRRNIISASSYRPTPEDCLRFTALQNNSKITPNISLSCNIEYSTDGVTWYPNTNSQITLSKIGDFVLFRGDNDQITTASGFDRFAMTGNIKASGNIMSILDRTCSKMTISAIYALARLFANCTALTDVSELILPARVIGSDTYESMFESSGVASMPVILVDFCANQCFAQMFKNCTSLKYAKTPSFKGQSSFSPLMNSMFEGCTSLEYACVDFSSFVGTMPNTNVMDSIFKGCTALKAVKYTLDVWGNGNATYTNNWLQDASANGVLICPAGLDTTTTQDASHMPSGWTAAQGSDFEEETEFPVVGESTSRLYVSPSNEVYHATVASAITIDGNACVGASKVAYAEVVLDLAASATVTAGTNLTLVDTPTAGSRNICVVRWSGGSARLYVTLTEDLPSSSSSASA